VDLLPPDQIELNSIAPLLLATKLVCQKLSKSMAMMRFVSGGAVARRISVCGPPTVTSAASRVTHSHSPGAVL